MCAAGHPELCATANLTWTVDADFPCDRAQTDALEECVQPMVTIRGPEVAGGCPDTPIALDASAETWPDAVTAKAGTFSLVYCSNVTHISPWEVTRGIIAGAASLLHANGRLVVYGPFKRGGAFTTESNRSFDEALRGRNPAWGYRDVESEVVPAAEARGLQLIECLEMPANNFLLAFGKRESSL